MNCRSKNFGSALCMLALLAVVAGCFGCTPSRLNVSVEVRDKEGNEPIKHAVVRIIRADLGPGWVGTVLRTDCEGVAATTIITRYDYFVVYVYVQGHDRHHLTLERGQEVSEVRTARLDSEPTLSVRAAISDAK